MSLATRIDVGCGAVEAMRRKKLIDGCMAIDRGLGIAVKEAFEGGFSADQVHAMLSAGKAMKEGPATLRASDVEAGVATEIERIAAGLSEAQRKTKFYGIGYPRLTKSVLALEGLGLVTTGKGSRGWWWKATDTGRAVRAHLSKTP